MTDKTRPYFEVVVGKVGSVYRGTDSAEAASAYIHYANLSASPLGGLVQFEPVTMLRDGEIVRELTPPPRRR